MPNIQQPMRAIRKRSWLIAILLLIIFVCSTYLRPDFFPSYRFISPQSYEQEQVEGYNGTVVFPLVMYTHSTILLLGTALAAVVFIWIWATQRPKWRNRLAIPLTIGGVIFLCSLCASSNDYGNFDKLRAVKVMDIYTNSDTLLADEHTYRLVLAAGRPTYSGGLSYYYGLIIFQCDSVGIMCHPALVQTWGTEDPIAGKAQDFQLSARPDEIDIVLHNMVIFRYHYPEQHVLNYF